ncbi:MAG: SufD family Fe-S cluster assembly protein [Paludibacteraceae bacterium]|nr:SufD family Fe-S cluster assembly protein [Paludibacteraceae bacterium]
MERIGQKTDLTLSRGETRELLLLEDTIGNGALNSVINIRQLERSDLTLFVITAKGVSATNNIRIIQEEPYCRTTLYVLAVGESCQEVVNNTLIEHQSTDGWSHELAKYVLDGTSSGTFFGELKVAPDAQRTESSQTNRNVLLSNDARVQTKPQLEIYADDVKCSHGATTGQLDEQAMFYMRQRGIGIEQARSMLIEAFLEEIIGKLPESVAEEVRQKIYNQAVNATTEI